MKRVAVYDRHRVKEGEMPEKRKNMITNYCYAEDKECNRAGNSNVIL